MRKRAIVIFRHKRKEEKALAKTGKGRPKASRQRKMQRAKRIGFTLLVLVTISCALVLAYFVTLTSKLEVVGNDTVSSQHIIALSGIDLGDNMYLIRTPKIAEKIEKDPILILDHIERKLPSTLIIYVRERKPFVQVKYLEDHLVLDETGRVLSIETSPKEDIPIAVGLAINSAAVGSDIQLHENYPFTAMQMVLKEAQKAGTMKYIQTIDVENPVLISFKTEQNITIKIGTTDELERKMEIINTMMPRYISEGKRSGTLNVSAPNNFTWSGE